MAAVSVKSSVVLDPQLEQERTDRPDGARIRCPLCSRSPRKDDLWSCTGGHEWNTFDHRRCMLRLSSAIDVDSVPILQWLVAAFRFVFAMR